MSNLWIPQRKKAPGTIGALSRRELERYAANITRSVKLTAVRAQMLACELQKVDPNNDIFKMTEGVLDKEHLFYVRKALNDGSYEKNRDMVRIK